MNYSEDYYLSLEMLRLEQERNRTARNSNQAPDAPVDLNAKEPSVASPRESFDKIRNAIYQQKRESTD